MTTSRLPLLPAEAASPATDAGAGALVTARGNLPLEAIEVAARITGLVARTELAQTFSNPYSEPLEATYVFPLPDRAAVTQFRMEVAGRTVEGLLQERQAARDAYDQAIAEGRRASIAEEDRAGVFTMRVGNLPPGEQARIRLVMTGQLPYDGGEATFRFPLVVAPRYIPGVPLEGGSVGAGTGLDTDAVPDASRITPPVLLPGFPNPVRLSIEVEVDPAGLPVGDLRSSLHVADVTERPAGRQGSSSGPVRVVRVGPGERVDRDFVLRLGLAGDALASALAATPDAEGEAGTFTLTLVPPAGADEGRPRDLAFVLDRSGSMGGWKMVAARRAVARMVDTLTERDRFCLLAFDNVVETPTGLGDQLQAASDRNRFRAVEFLAALQARGGTELAAPLTRALDRLSSGVPGAQGAEGGSPRVDASERDLVLVLVTDGQVGNEDQLLRLLAGRLGGVRVYTVGVDTAVNEAFLRRLAGLGGGGCELVESEDRLDAVMERVHRRTGAPVLTDLELVPDGLGADLDTLAPGRLPALFPGAPLVVAGRYRGRPEGAITVRGRDGAGRPWSATVPATETGNPALARVWARAHLRDLEDRYAAGPAPDDGLERRIVDTSLRFGVLCRFTAFVAADTEVTNEGGRVHQVIQPVEVPADWEPPALRPLALAMPVAGMAVGRGGLAAERMGAAAPAPHGKVGGLLRPPGRPFAGRPTRPPEPLAGAELAAYRERAGDLARLLADGEQLDRRLGLVRVRLAALLDDLASVGAAEPELAGLRELAAALDRLDAGQQPGPAELAALRDRATAALTRFAGAPPPPGPGPGGQPPRPGVPARPAPAPRRAWWRRAD